MPEAPKNGQFWPKMPYLAISSSRRPNLVEQSCKFVQQSKTISLRFLELILNIYGIFLMIFRFLPANFQISSFKFPDFLIALIGFLFSGHCDVCTLCTELWIVNLFQKIFLRRCVILQHSWKNDSREVNTIHFPQWNCVFHESLIGCHWIISNLFELNQLNHFQCINYSHIGGVFFFGLVTPGGEPNCTNGGVFLTAGVESGSCCLFAVADELQSLLLHTHLLDGFEVIPTQWKWHQRRHFA